MLYEWQSAATNPTDTTGNAETFITGATPESHHLQVNNGV